MSEVHATPRREYHYTEIEQRIGSAEEFADMLERNEPLVTAGYRDAARFARLPVPGREVLASDGGILGRVVSLARIRTHKPGAEQDWRVEIQGKGFYLPSEIGYALP